MWPLVTDRVTNQT